MQGKGVLRYANGDVYEGEFHGNVPHGTGKYTYADGEVCDGQFEKGEFVDAEGEYEEYSDEE